MVGGPPEATLTPRLSEVGLLEFWHADHAIREGRRAVERMADELSYVLRTG